MKQQAFSDEIREAIRRSGRSVYAISKDLGITGSVLHRFMHGKALSTTTLDRVAKMFDLHIVIGKKRKDV